MKSKFANAFSDMLLHPSSNVAEFSSNGVIIVNKSALVQIMACGLTDDKPLHELVFTMTSTIMKYH